MDGDGGDVVDQSRGSAAFDLPSVLARLDGHRSVERRAAVETIVSHAETHPDACLAAVPKLRDLLAEPECECLVDVAVCLAALAEHSPVDVAPSADELVAFVGEHPTHEATPPLLSALAAVAADRPSVLVERVEAVAAGLESDDPAARADAAAVLGTLAGEPDARVEAVRGRLATVERDDPDATVRERAAEALEQFS